MYLLQTWQLSSLNSIISMVQGELSKKLVIISAGEKWIVECYKKLYVLSNPLKNPLKKSFLYWNHKFTTYFRFKQNIHTEFNLYRVYTIHICFSILMKLLSSSKKYFHESLMTGTFHQFNSQCSNYK